MLFAVSTIMDTPAHVRRYVEGNLAGGVDHLIVFLDKPRTDEQREVADYLAGQPAVTCVAAGRSWWGDGRPQGLNERQCTNANVAKQVLADLGLTGWVAHVDGDEILRVDRQALDAVPPAQQAVRFLVREAVSSREWTGQPTAFKAELSERDLELLHGLGLLAEASNQSWIRGHLMGKSATRIEGPGWLTLHKVVLTDGTGIDMHEDGGAFELFHYESYSAEDFVRKWTSIVHSGTRPKYRAERQGMARTLRDLISRGLEPEALRRQLERYYDRSVAEPLSDLRDLEILHEVDPLTPLTQQSETPGLSADDAHRLAEAIEQHRGVGKQHLFMGTSPGTGARAGRERRADQRDPESSRGWSRLGRRSP